jgi:hypothetical protein
MTWILTLLGPAWMVLRAYVPAVVALRSAAWGAAALALVGGGAWLVWTVRHQDEAPRIQRAAEAIVDKANLTAHVEQLEGALKQGAETLVAREAALTKTAAELAALKKAQEAKRHASPDPDAVCIPAGDPWLGGVGLRK